MARLMVGILVALLAGLGAKLRAVIGLSLTASIMFEPLLAGLNLHETRNVIHNGETNCIMVTVTLPSGAPNIERLADEYP